MARAFALLIALMASRVLVAQSIRSTVLDWQSGRGIEGAFVSLLDTTGTVILGQRADRRGRVTLGVREPGVYALMAEQPGYRSQVSGWIQVAASDTLEVTLRLAPLAPQLEQVTITAQRDSLLSRELDGIPLRTLAGTIVTEAEVKRAAAGTTRMTDVIQNLNIPSVRLRQFRVSTGIARQDGQRECLAQQRAPASTGRSPGGGRGPCLLIVIDGLRLVTFEDLVNLNDLVSPDRVKGIVMLRPAEAGTLFGSDGSNGVLLIFTKDGGR